MTADPEQVVREYEPYRRLSYTWHSLTPDWAKAVGLSEDVYAGVPGEGRSKVTFEIEPLGALTELTVVHDGFDEGSVLHSMLSQGCAGTAVQPRRPCWKPGEPLPEPERAAQDR